MEGARVDLSTDSGVCLAGLNNVRELHQQDLNFVQEIC